MLRGAEAFFNTSRIMRRGLVTRSCLAAKICWRFGDMVAV